ncbi:MAG: hypothetical protein R3B45_16330 [Bdellovibrionota bacterium]
MNSFDVFRGSQNKKGQVLKVRSVGLAYCDESSQIGEIHINDLPHQLFYIYAEESINHTFDYTIFIQDRSTEELIPVGVGYLLVGDNAGLIRLDWDFYNNSNIYINLTPQNNKTSLGLAA